MILWIVLVIFFVSVVEVSLLLDFIMIWIRGLVLFLWSNMCLCLLSVFLVFCFVCKMVLFFNGLMFVFLNWILISVWGNFLNLFVNLFNDMFECNIVVSICKLVIILFLVDVRFRFSICFEFLLLMF